VATLGKEGCAQGLFSRDFGETETLKPESQVQTKALTIQAEARPRPRLSELDTETRPRHTNSEARPSRATTVPQGCLETEASRPRPHPCWKRYCIALRPSCCHAVCVRAALVSAAKVMHRIQCCLVIGWCMLITGQYNIVCNFGLVCRC